MDGRWYSAGKRRPPVQIRVGQRTKWRAWQVWSDVHGMCQQLLGNVKAESARCLWEEGLSGRKGAGVRREDCHSAVPSKG